HVYGFIIYSSSLIEHPYCFVLLPIPLMFILLFFFIWSRHFQTYIRDADRIFLMKNRPLYIGLKQITILYTFATPIFYTTMIGLLIAPFWLKLYQLEFKQLLLFIFLFLSSRWFEI